MSRSKLARWASILFLGLGLGLACGSGGSKGPTYSISGTVSGAIAAGVTVTLSGAASQTATTDASGSYTFSGLPDGSYAVTPSLAGYIFSPTSRAVQVSGADVSGQDFAATAHTGQTYSISGTVSGAASSGVTVTLAGPSTGSTVTSSGGSYAFSGLPDGSYTVTPSLSGYSFNPANRAVQVSGANVSGQDFSAVHLAGTVARSIPRDGSLLASNETIFIRFSKSMDTNNSLALKGTLGKDSDGGTWSSSGFENDTLELRPMTNWPPGAGQDLTVEATDLAGNPTMVPLSVRFHVADSDCLFHVRTDGNDQNSGLPDSPMATIPAAIAAGKAKVDAKECTAAAVLVAEGTYEVDSSAVPPTNVVLSEGISIYGGYNKDDWSKRDPAVYLTIVRDVTTAGGGVWAAVKAPIEVTRATVIDGLEIEGGEGDETAALSAEGSPVIQNSTLRGQAGGRSGYTIHLTGSSAAIIRNNLVESQSSGQSSYGIQIESSGAPLIHGNLIYGGDGDQFTFGIACLGGQPVIRNNTIHGGGGAMYSHGIYLSSCAPVIENNVVVATGNATYRVCIMEGSGSADPSALRNNLLFDCPAALYADMVGGSGGNCPFNKSMNCYTDIADVNDAAQTTQGIVETASGNVTGDPSFVSLNGNDGDPGKLKDNDWRPQISSPACGAGLDLSVYFTVDLSGNLRTVPWSIGAYRCSSKLWGTKIEQ